MSELATLCDTRWSSALARFYELAPYFPRCSTQKNAVLTRPKHLAVRMPYIQVNPKCMVSWLVFDLDEIPDWYTWETAGLPAPNLIVRDEAAGCRSAHWYYAITPVAKGPNARERPVAFLKAVYRAMVARIQPADIRYSNGPVAKTPGNPRWRTTELHAREYSLGELADYLDFGTTPHQAANDEAIEAAEGESRHLWMFDYLRKQCAYPRVQEYRQLGDYAAFERMLMIEAESANRFAQTGWNRPNLRLSQLRSTCKSIARWTWNHYTGRGDRCNRGAMKLDPSLPLSLKQRLSAARTHQRRRSDTQERIVTAIQSLRSSGDAITFSSVARLSGLSRQTVARYRDLVEDVAIDCSLKPAQSKDEVQVQRTPLRSSPALLPSKQGSRVVKFGAHQISTCKGVKQPASNAGSASSEITRRRIDLSGVLQSARSFHDPPEQDSDTSEPFG